MDVKPMDDDVAHELRGDARSARDVHGNAAPIDRLERVHQQFFLELDGHVASEDDPEWLLFYDGVSEGTRFGCNSIVVAGVGDDVDFAVPSADGILAEADRAVGKPLSVRRPVGITPPAVVNGVTSVAR